MSQRNPMNERNTIEGAKKGVTRKSASAAKPKREAAASVHIAEKSAKQKKAEKKEARRIENERQRKLDNKYYNPPTAEYKRMRRIWWIVLGAAIVMTILVFVGQSFLPSWAQVTLMVLAYAAIFAAIYIDMVKIRRIRRAYQAQMMGSKEERKAEKAAKAQRTKATQQAATQEAAPAEEKKGFFSRFGKKNKAEEPAATDAKTTK